MRKYKFIEKARELGYSEEFINDTVNQTEQAKINEDIFLDYDEKILCELPED